MEDKKGDKDWDENENENGESRERFVGESD